MRIKKINIYVVLRRRPMPSVNPQKKLPKARLISITQFIKPTAIKGNTILRRVSEQGSQEKKHIYYIKKCIHITSCICVYICLHMYVHTYMWHENLDQ